LPSRSKAGCSLWMPQVALMGARYRPGLALPRIAELAGDAMGLCHHD
jgi:hypothetical protein